MIANNINPPTSTKNFFLNKDCKSANTSSGYKKGAPSHFYILFIYTYLHGLEKVPAS
ncbi:uncharacterized protein METZ01_LOCUS398898, partial [marine metagenome]